MEPERLYTVAEANGSLPDLRERLERIRAARQELLGTAKRVRGRAVRDGGGGDGRGYFDALGVLRVEVQALAERGILLRDPETGLVDFPSTRAGKRVFLCWRLGEERVAHWHDVDSGFAGRRPL